MEDLKKSLERLLLKQKRQPKPKHLSQPHINGSYAEYVDSLSPRQQIRVRSFNYMKQHNQQQQNLRLFQKLTKIRSRDKIYDRSPEQQKTLDNIYQLNQASRRLQRKIKQKDLQDKNNQFIERIVQIKTHHSPHLVETIPLANSRQHKRSIKSVLLPPILDPEPN